MGSYTTRTVTTEEYKTLIQTIRNGYEEIDGTEHRPNPQVATILVAESNLGCRLSDVIKLRTDSIKQEENGRYVLDIVEQKTGKRRTFVVPRKVKEFLDAYAESKEIYNGNIFTITEQAVWKAVRQATAYLGMENVSTHSMRKRAALNLYEKSGYDIALVSQFLQHADTKTTQTYLRRNTQQMEQAIEGMVDLV